MQHYAKTAPTLTSIGGLEVPPAERPLLKAVIEAELGRLHAKGGLGPALAAGVAVPEVGVDGIEHGSGTGPTRLGEQIARSAYGGLTR